MGYICCQKYGGEIPPAGHPSGGGSIIDKKTPNTAANGVSWATLLAPYRGPVLSRSLWQLISTAALFVASWALMYFSLRVSYWLTLALAIPTAFLMVRLFIIQHDCGHGSFFKSTALADTVGAILGVITLTPYHYWKKTHAIHHATSGNLEHRGFGDIDTMTIAEYLRLSRWGRFKYRLYRNPLVLFGVGAIIHFFVRHRLPTIIPADWKRERRSILYTDLGLAVFVLTMAMVFGLKEFLLMYLPFTLIACSLGVWLFYVQHQFEPTYWEHDSSWQYEAAALEGSSFLRLPQPLQWLTGNIGLHHVHHLNARIPNYRLQEVFDKHPELQKVTTITLWQSFRCVRLALWDEEKRRLVKFRDAMLSVRQRGMKNRIN